VPGVVVHRSTGLRLDDIMTRNHIRTVKPLVTALDLGVVLTPMDLAEVLVRARQLKLFDPAAVRTTLGRLARPGRNGIRVCRDALELVMIGDRPADSVLELRFHHGPGRLLPPYEYQFEVRVKERNYRIDFAYPEVKLAIEVDGLEKRKSLEALQHDARRTTHLVQAGWTVPRFTWPDVKFRPDSVASDVLGLLRALGYNFCR
jgi:very-short-patch-repair endonuclease